MAEGMTGRPFGDSSVPDSLCHGPLHNRFMNMVAALFSGLMIYPKILLRKYPLPTPFARSVRIFTIESVRHLNTPTTFGQVALVNRFNLLEMVLKRNLERLSQHCNAIFRTLAVSNKNFVTSKID